MVIKFINSQKYYRKTQSIFLQLMLSPYYGSGLEASTATCFWDSQELHLNLEKSSENSNVKSSFSFQCIGLSLGK